MTWWADLSSTPEGSDDDITITASSQTASNDSQTVNNGTARDMNALNATQREQSAPNAKDPGDMTYQCDSSLGGAPDRTDCEQLSWSGLKYPDSVEILEPNIPKFYSQGVCLLSPKLIKESFSTCLTR